MLLQKLDERTTVLRDDILEGGSKSRFLPFLVAGAKEVVFGGPFCGGAPWALSVVARKSGGKLRATLFYAKRKEWHKRQKMAQANGAKIIEVTPGYMTNVQAKARAYAQANGALFLPLGFDIPAAEDPFVEFIRSIRAKIGDVDQVWCCAGSGMLARCLSKGFPNSSINAVTVGLASRHEAQHFGPNVILHPCAYKFEQETRATAPFPSCGNYDRKAWEVMQRARGPGSALFYNVAPG